MLPGSHFFVASALASKFSSNFLSSFIIGFISHHLFDLLPHIDFNIFKTKKNRSFKEFNFGDYLIIFIEFIFFVILTFYFLNNFSLEKQKLIIISGIAGVLPDIITFFIGIFSLKLKFLDFYLRFHKNFHFKLKNNFFSYFLAVISQIIVIFSAFIIFN